MQKIIDQILFALAEKTEISDKEGFHRLKNEILAEYKIPNWPSSIELLDRYSELVKTWQISDELRIRKILRKRAVRSLSGVSVISLLTKFWGCPWKCIYCPTYDNLPKSYISNEPAVQRAEMNAFDPFLQVQNRLQSLSITGNAISKCDVRIIGGTWSVYPRKYQEDFIKNIYDAHTLFGEVQNIEEEKTPLERGDMGGEKYFSHSKNAIPYNPELLEKARENRKNANSVEKKFWYEILKNENFSSYKFTRQKPLLDYIVDFYCSEYALVVEIDGDSHIENEKYDTERTEKLEKFWLKIIRYTNKEVMENTEWVAENLLKILKNSTPHPPLEGGQEKNSEKISQKFFSAKTEKPDNIILSETIEEAKKRNETATSRVIGMAIETRPDWVNIDEIKRLRSYGITRVEIGYQTTHDEINEKNIRGHGNAESIEATKMLKDAGFKVVAHMMPGLVGATPELDKSAMKRVFDDADFRPDEIKIYPMVVTPNSELTKMWERGEFEPYDDELLIPLMAELQSYLPEYVRLNRMYRDIPASEILAGSKTANLRQVTEIVMRKKWLKRHDISAREIRAKWNNPENAVLETTFYEASGGHEYFLQMIDPSDRTIFGLLRLRVPSQYFSGEKHFIEELDNSAIIREIHVFGDQIPVGFTGDNSGQHQGFGKKMLAEAEKIIREKYPTIAKMAVISGVGVREYYAKRGYHLEGEYMVKDLK